MNGAPEFIDYYARLQVSPGCDAKMLEKAYRYAAQQYHPDHTQTADVDKFQEVTEAYRILRDPTSRAEYDKTYNTVKPESVSPLPSDSEFRIDEKSAVDDAEAHAKILYYLYKRRRENPREPDVIGFYIQDMLGCSDENFDFHAWYLKSKGFMRGTEHGTYEITIEGVDHVISMSRTAEAEKLLLAQSAQGEEPQ